MYLTNKYTKWYNAIIAQAGKRVNQTGYVEQHHIIPKSLGGTNDPENLVKLTAREHFICHLLLTKMVSDPAHKRSMYYASYMMVRGHRTRHYLPSSRLYEITRKRMIEAQKERPGPNLGKKWSEEVRKKQSESRKGISRGPMSEEHKKKLSKPKSEEAKKKMSASRIGKSWGYKHSEETKRKIGGKSKGRFQGTKTCEHCNKQTSIGNYNRWHGNNCKQRNA